jgi:hypothetical protein
VLRRPQGRRTGRRQPPRVDDTLAEAEDGLDHAALGDDERERDIVRSRRERRDLDLGESPRDADRDHVRVLGEPAVVIAAAEAEAMTGASEADAWNDDDVGDDRRAVARGDAAFVDQRRRLAVPAPELERARHAPCIWQRARRFVERRVGGERGRCVKFRAQRPIQAETGGLEGNKGRAKVIRQGDARRIGGGGAGEGFALGEQSGSQRLARRALDVAAGVGLGRDVHEGTGTRVRTADRMNPVYEPDSPRRIAGRLARALAPLSLALLVALSALPRTASAQGVETTVVDARDAFRRHDRVRLAALKTQAAAERNPLAMWVDYWELTNRINEVQPPEFAAFVQRWPATYVEDRLRNDWLLELVRRRDSATFAAEYPRFRMNDDREVTCFALASDQLSGKDVRDAAIAAWLAQKDADDG